MLKAANKVFSKHSRFEIKQWANKLMMHYNLLISNEKPLNLDYARPFSNTNDLVRNVPDISQSTANQKEKRDQELEDFNIDAQKTKEIYIEKQKMLKMSQSDKEKYEDKQLSMINYDRPLTIGFLQRKFVNNYYVYKRVLSELQRRDPKFKPETSMDFGAGLGSASWASLHTYKSSLKRMAAVEPNPNMRQLGRFLSKE
jgi:ribosomal protein RSM22 (predicted rRNA methylase)